jgi:excinuclease ABC subunit C
VTFNRARRAVRTLTSELLRIPGVGPNRRRALLRAFGSLQGVRDASPEDIAKVPGFSKASAERILQVLRGEAEPAAPEAITQEVAAPDAITQEVPAVDLPDSSEVADHLRPGGT